MIAQKIFAVNYNLVNFCSLVARIS